MKVTFTAPNKLAKKQTYTPDKIKRIQKARAGEIFGRNAEQSLCRRRAA